MAKCGRESMKWWTARAWDSWSRWLTTIRSQFKKTTCDRTFSTYNTYQDKMSEIYGSKFLRSLSSAWGVKTVRSDPRERADVRGIEYMTVTERSRPSEPSGMLMLSVQSPQQVNARTERSEMWSRWDQQRDHTQQMKLSSTHTHTHTHTHTLDIDRRVNTD